MRPQTRILRNILIKQIFVNRINLFMILIIIYSGVSQSEEPIFDKNTYEGKDFVLRRLVNHSTVFYPDPPLDTSMVFSQYKDDRTFLYQKDRNVEILRMKSDRTGAKITFEIESEVIGRQKIEIISPKAVPISRKVLSSLFNRMFTRTDVSKEYKYFAYESVRNIVHVRGSNHVPLNATYSHKLPDKDHTEYKLCKACFRFGPRIPYYQLENSLRVGLEEAYRRYNPVVVIDSMQEYIEKIGYKVLNNWPFPLLGYQYKFYVVENSKINAVAIPGGTIFIHSGLLDAVDNQMELEAILAHEITHVEFQHSVRQLLKRQEKKFLGGLLSILTSVAIGWATEDPEAFEVAYSIAKPIADLATEFSLAGYSISHEIEADEIAALYLYYAYSEINGKSLTNILHKMKYSMNLSENDFSVGLDDTHPKIISRIKYMRNLNIIPLEEPPIFAGYDSLGREVCKMKIIYMASRMYLKERYDGADWDGDDDVVNDLTWETRYMTTVYASILSTEYLYSTEEIKHFTARIDNHKMKFDNKDDAPLAPLSAVGCVFVCDSKIAIDVRKLIDFDLEVRRTVKWNRVN